MGFVHPIADEILRPYSEKGFEQGSSSETARAVRGNPNCPETAATFARLGALRVQDCDELLHELLQALSVSPTSELRARIVGDILDTWKVLILLARGDSARANRGHVVLGDELLSDWSFLSYFDHAKVLQARRLRGLRGVFQILLPAHLDNLHDPTFNAIITFAMFVDPNLSSSVPHLEHHPFVRIVGQLLAFSQVSPLHLSQFLRSREPRFLDKLDLELTAVLQRAKTLTFQTEEREYKDFKRIMPRHAGPKTPESQSISRRLTRALFERDLETINHLWRSAHKLPSLGDGMLPRTLCDQFVKAYMSLRQADRAIEVWNQMATSSEPPTMASWNAMLEGCRAARDVRSLEGVWAKMIAAGLKPDAICWTTRVSGLIQCQKIDAGMAALREMGEAWIVAAKKYVAEHHLDANPKDLGDVDGVVKPTIAVINAAIAGLLRSVNIKLAQHLLSWGGNLGVQPDIITFNTLLRFLIRQNNVEGVKFLLNHMGNTRCPTRRCDVYYDPRRDLHRHSRLYFSTAD